ncbi:MAG: helix-turn-helix domain-containing protein [Moraxella sp.]|nr:helix-turn-helix domain-containing protein [Moraxella sp.]
MSLAHTFVHIAHVIGHPSRALMLDALLGTQRLSALELADSAGITAQTASRHLQLLVKAGLLSVEQQGKYRYFYITDIRVHGLLQQLAEIHLDTRPSAHSSTYHQLQEFRCCYQHMAGQVGVSITNALIAKQIIALIQDDFVLTDDGQTWLDKFDITPTELTYKACTDWTERVPHLAGELGEQLLEMFLNKGFARISKTNHRALELTNKG